VPSVVEVHLGSEVRRALEAERPLVALESTVLAHGLPYPENLALGQRLESTIRERGAVPATIAVLGGQLRVGLDGSELERVARSPRIEKLSRRDLPVAVALGQDGATTVAATMLLAQRAGIRVMATGGIGGVHRGDGTDVSADLPELARTPVIVVASGAKAILDLPATVEWLETFGVPVLGYATDEFPAFYSVESGLPVATRVDDPRAVVAIARAAWATGFSTGVLVAVPCPDEAALPAKEVAVAIDQALGEAATRRIHGKAVTPFLLQRLAELTGRATLRANLALLARNAAVGAEIAVALGPLESAGENPAGTEDRVV
jgi:pseudouridylate synthase